MIGTAGHVDHGKTALVKALTGTDTDRLPEEKRRGITIDLGFARLALDDGIRASVVDVPGHEDFIRNMVAGATGVDVVLLVVAADEGVMPQTLEHLAILEILGVGAGAVALTKADLVEPDWLELVRSDVGERLRKTTIGWEPPVAVSAMTGQGLGEIRSALTRSAARASDRAADDLFRMPVDRVFSLAGAGTVVTGTTWSGSVKVGDQVSLLPEGAAARVRSVEVHGEHRELAEPGRRTALALAGLDRASVGRGSVVVSDASWRATSSIDVTLSLLPAAPRRVTQRARIRLHLGTDEVIARVTPATGDILPGASGLVRLRLEAPVVARWGDRGVIRAYSPVATIGGCVVIDPWPAARPRRPTVDSTRASAQPVERVRGYTLAAGLEGIEIGDLLVRVGIHAGLTTVVEAALEGRDLLRIGDRLVSAGAVREVREATLRALLEHHRSHPLEPGMPLQLLRRRSGSEKVAEHVYAELAREGKIALDGGTARLAGHAPALDRSQETAGGKLLAALVAAGSEGRTLDELDGLGLNESAGALAEYYVRQGTAVRVGQDRYYDREALERLARAALAEIVRLETATPAQVREKLGLSRKYLIPLLEWLDLKGFTLRGGEGRQVTKLGRQYLGSEA